MTTTMALIILLGSTNLLWFVLYLTKNSRVLAVLRTAMRKAEADRTDWVRIQYNQLGELLGWRKDQMPMRDKFGQKPGPHPARLRPQRRQGLAL